MEHKRWFSIEKLTYVALLVALQVILGNVTQLPSLGKQFNFGFLPIAVAGALFGAPAAIIVGGLGDFFGAHLFPVGAYNVCFTVTNMLVGLLYGLPLYKHKLSWSRVIVATLLVEACYLLLNTYWLSLFFIPKAYGVLLATRAVSYLFEIPIYTVLTYLTLQGLKSLKLPSSLHNMKASLKETKCESVKPPSSKS